MKHHPLDLIRSAIKASLPGSRIVLIGSHYYEEQIVTSDYDVLVLSTFPVSRSKKQKIVGQLAREHIKYDIHFIPKLFIHLGWKYVAGKDLDSEQDIRLQFNKKIRSAVFASRIKMAYYYYAKDRYGDSTIALLRAKILPNAKTDIDIFSFRGNLCMIDKIRDTLSEDEYRLYKQVLTNRNNSREEELNTSLLLSLINDLYLDSPDNLFQLQHNLQYYLYSIKNGSLKVLVNYNGVITRALHHYTNDDPEESARQLSKLTKVTNLDEQIREYSCLSLFEMKN